MSVANNMQIELDTVESIAARLLGVMNTAALAEIKTDPFEPLFNNEIALAFQGTLPVACKTGDSKGRKISELTKGTIAKEREADNQGKGLASGMTVDNLIGAGGYQLNVNSSDTETDNDQNMKVRNDDEGTQFDAIMEGLSYQSYIKMMESLQNMEKEELQSYLTDLDFAPALKQWLLTSPKINTELKEAIFNMEPATIQANLRNILEHSTPANDLTQDIIYSFYQTDLSGEMFKNMSVATADEMVSVIDGMFSSGDTQTELYNIYEGKANNLAGGNDSFFKTLVDVITQQTGVTSTELLSNRNYNAPLTECLENVSETFAYTGAVSQFSGRPVGELLLELTKGV